MILRKCISRAYTLLAIALFCSGCDVYYPPEPPPERKIDVDNIIAEPNPVATGDTTVISVIFNGSLDTSLTFRWNFPGSDIGEITKKRSVSWIADVPADTYRIHVSIFSRDKNASTNGGVDVVVVDNLYRYNFFIRK